MKAMRIQLNTSNGIEQSHLSDKQQSWKPRKMGQWTPKVLWRMGSLLIPHTGLWRMWSITLKQQGLRSKPTLSRIRKSMANPFY
ncbi:hypothetical protein R3I94_021520 [Phoxinus phoxinus]|uniref:Uncharacterized protein n=1 Tax=Phoxinus phoxinus TaxID=58324 RepID=A0AAN9CCK2_9TELE